MFLELTSVPSMSIYGGPIAFAHVPWQIPLCECDDAQLSNCIRRTKMSFITQWGTGFRFRLVLETVQERIDFELSHGELPSALWSATRAQRTGQRTGELRALLDVDEVLPPELASFVLYSRSLTPLEELAIDELRGVMRQFEERYGALPRQWTLADPIARKNLARAAEEVGLRLVDPSGGVA